MSQVSVGKLLPNLKVTLGNDQVDNECSSDAKDMATNSKVEVVRRNIDNLNNPKVYMNRDGGFATGIDLIEEENSGILSKRAERFGLDVTEPKQSITSLYESLGMDIKNKDSAKMKHVRFDTIHIRGVNNFSTEEVFIYFRQHGPDKLEWINDTSCNVIFPDETSCARALLRYSKPTQGNNNTKVKKIVEDLDEPDISSLDLKENPVKEEMEVDSSASDVEVNIPVPPGRWRMGDPHPKAESLWLRFATKDDIKVPGAEKRSQYYKKFGNPNYGGLKGCISSSKKQRTQAAANRLAVERESSFKSSSSSLQSSSNTVVPKKQKVMRMRMYADDEELKTKKLRSKSNLDEKKGNVHSRLGTKYTAEDLCRLGNYRDWDNPRNQVTEYSYKYKPKSSSLDLRSKLKKIRSNYHREEYAGESSRSGDRESAFGSIKQYKRVDEIKQERRSFYKRKHRSPLCQDDDDDDDDDAEETSGSA